MEERSQTISKAPRRRPAPLAPDTAPASGARLVARLVLLASALLCGLAPAVATAVPAQSVREKLLATARSARESGDAEAARLGFERVLERDPKQLEALAALSELHAEAGEADRAVDYAGRFLDIWRHLERAPKDMRAVRRSLEERVDGLDPFGEERTGLARRYVTKLLAEAERSMEKGAWHTAHALFEEAQAADPEHPDLAAGLVRISKEGGNELAREDETAGVDPLEGVDEDWVEREDPLHEKWSKRWKLETEHYRVETNAGYRTLKIVAHAMEQMQVFYREFHRYKVDGGSVPTAGVLIFKDRPEYMSIGGAPVEWAGGHWDGSKVVTYDHRAGGEGSLRDTLQTLFHEASHQFTSLAGGSGVPSWLNEGMASFFEGTRLLSNGRVDWNLIAPGRLYPLIDDLSGTSPNRLANVIQGQVEDYRVYYPWGWGIVYYLFNAEDDDGNLLYRDRLAEYFQDYHTSDHLGRFVEFWVTGAKVPGVNTIEDFERNFIAYVKRLEQEDKGLIDVAAAFEERGDKRLARDDAERAVQLYRRAIEKEPGRVSSMEKLARALEAADDEDRAVGAWRRLLVRLASLGDAGGSAHAALAEEARRKITQLDGTQRRLKALRKSFREEARGLAARYREKGFPRLALRVLESPATATPPDDEARALYLAIAEESGVELETWRLLCNEEDLEGFYGGGLGNFRVLDGVIEARVAADGSTDIGSNPSSPRAGESQKAGSSFLFRRLFIDREPAGDWSLSAEIQLRGRGRLAGLCFGKKADGSFHGISLLAEGVVDLARIESDGRTLARVPFDRSGAWTRLRLDVAGRRLTVSVDDSEVLTETFPTQAPLRGDFGLLAGEGTSAFRDVKLLEFDPNLPRPGRGDAATASPADDLESEGPVTLQREEPGQLAYKDKVPPPLAVKEWLGAEPQGGGDLDRLAGWPVLIVFWTTYQEDGVPFLPALERLRPTLEQHGIPVLLVGNQRKEDVAAWLEEHPLELPVGIDPDEACFEHFAIERHGLPRALLIDTSGRVAWEGNPDYHPDFGSYVEEPLKELVERENLVALSAAEKDLDTAEAAWTRGEREEAVRAWEAVAKIESEHRRVRTARARLEAFDASVREEIESASALAEEGRVTAARRTLARLVREGAGRPCVADAQKALEGVDKSKAGRAAKKIANRLVRAEKDIARGRGAKALGTLEKTRDELASASSTDPELVERVGWLVERLAAGEDGDALVAAFRERFGPLVDAGE